MYKRQLQLLAKGKILRGTVFDPFGYTQERRHERAEITDYEVLVAEILSGLSSANLDAAVKLASLVDMIRGYGPVKVAAKKAYAAALPAARAAFRSAVAVNTVAA